MAVNGNRIRQLRKEAELTQEAIGKKLGVIKQTVSSWENGISEPNSDVLSNMASIFGVSIDYLLGNDIPDDDTKKHNNTNKTSDTSARNYFFFGEENILRNVFTKRIKTAISDIGITEEEFKNGISFGKEKATSFLDGTGEPTANDLIELSKFLDTSIDYLLGQINERTDNMLSAFKQLNVDNRDIIIGETKKTLKSQRYEESVAADTSLKKTGTTNSVK